ncbi:MAG: nuclear transport factor 2 family protein [Actinomycetota bacterium]|nr:nuclear transport factor 2 family protein [Actinomycetota bacterium]
MDLVELELIRQLKYRYLRNLDLKQWDEFGQTLTVDVTASYGDRLSFSGREDVVAYMRQALGAGAIITVHQCHHPEITVDADSATGRWYLEDKVIITDHRLMLTGAAFYDDTYRRCEDGKWRIAKTSYIRSYEAMQSLDDTPSWSLTANRWATAPG